MKYSIVYSSKGNTKLLADAIYENLNKEDCFYFGPTIDKAKDADTIYVGFWTNQGCCDEISMEFLKSLHNKNIFIFGSCGFGLSDDYFDKIINASLKYIDSSNKVIGTFICQGKMKRSVLERYEKMKKEDPENKKIDMMIKNFYDALSHPNDKDIAKLISKIK